MLRTIKNKSHPIWVFLQEFFARGIVALKFLILARLLGPESIGLISVALVSLAMIEALTEMGLMHAIVHKKHDLTKNQQDTLWTLQLLRGIAISIFLLILSPVFELLFSIEGTQKIVMLIAMVPILRNSVSIGFFIFLRNKDYRTMSIIQVTGVLVDIILSIILVIILDSPYMAIVGLIFSEVFRTILSHLFSRSFPRLNFNFSSIRDVLRYGKWIWANSISTFLFSQFDKLLASRFLGAGVLGLYQMSQKFSQMALYDTSNAFQKYYFPVFSHLHRSEDKNFKTIFLMYFYITFNFLLLIATFLYLNSELIIKWVLGQEWLDMVSIFQFMLISAFLSGVLSVSIAYLRSIGMPQVVTKLSYIQLMLVIVFSILGVHYFGVYGLIAANIIGYFVANIIQYYITFKKIEIPKTNVIRGILPGIIYSCLLYLTILIIENEYIRLVISLFLLSGVLFSYIFLIKKKYR